MKVKISASYIMLIILLFILALFVSLLTGVVRIEDVFFFVMGTLVSWIVLIVLALIGAIFIGMFLSHRILSIGGFTPFEEEMLKMRRDMEAMDKKLDDILGKMENPGSEKYEKGTDEKVRENKK